LTPSRLNRILLITTIIVEVIAAIDAGISGEWDLFVVALIALTLLAALLIRFQSTRPAVPLRADVVRWLQRQSAVTGEPLTQITDRALSTYRAAQRDEPDPI
jgi:hypothetical protein